MIKPGVVYTQGDRPVDSEPVLSLVNSRMKVRDYYARVDGSLEFSIEQTSTLKLDFLKLVRRLKSHGMIAMLRRSGEEGLALAVTATKPQKTKLRPWMAVALFAVTVAVVMFDGLLRSDTASGRAYINDPWEMAVIYTISLIGILGIHELGHMLAARKHRVKATWPFFIPGVPGFFVSPPTFGAVIFSKGYMPNRDILFDIGFAGPIAGLAVTMLVSIYGAMLSPLVPAQEAMDLMNQARLINIPPSLLMLASFSIMGKLVDGFMPIMSPVSFAAWIGFLITFLNLLPAWQLDGGHIARAALGIKWHRRMTYASVVILAALGYIVMAVFIMIMSSRTQDLRPLDDVSPLSKNRKIVFVVSLFLAFLCAPLPFSF